ncbi:hypothetical protein TWF506_000638 [Arthrobotrys conoides]|uniref:Uncharacterized protein n=1 Tax=Arthrobotrys conoides TaxID=74498 RepID=A0AAN8RXQ0_9PEZI
MASRTVLHHAALKITPPPRTLLENREIYRSLRKFGEIDLYRSLRHETSTLEVKDDAIVLFRDEAALGDAFEASPINVSMPTAPSSPIPSLNLNSVVTPADPLFYSKFTVEISKREHNHETRIIDQLFAAPYSITQETPPGTSTSSILKSDIIRAPDANEYRTNLARATGGGWKGWRLEMKQAGIPTWDSIKPTSDIINTTALESGSARSRMKTVSWGRPFDPFDVGIQDVAQPVLPKNISSTISNPTPLPLDPTLQPVRRQRQPQVGGAHISHSTMRNPTGWWRSAGHAEGRNSLPSSQQDQSRAPSLVENSNRSLPGPISFKAFPQNDSEGLVAKRSLNLGTTPPTGSENLTSNPGNIIRSESRPILSDTNVLSVTETQQLAEPKLGVASKPAHASNIPRIHETQASQQNKNVPVFVHDIPSVTGKDVKEQPQGNAEAFIDLRIEEKIPSKKAQLEQTSLSNPQQAGTTVETAPVKKKWWSLPWQRTN